MAEQTDEYAVVVGATGTLGGAIARRLTKRGLRVVAVGRDGEKLARLAGESELVVPCRADIATDEAIDTINGAIGGPVRMAVMCAGLPVRGSALTIETGGLATAANIKVDGLLRLLRAVEHGLGQDSRLVVITGFLAAEPTAHEAAPGAINAAVHNLVRQIAELLGPRGTTVHAVSPGPVDTERIRTIGRRIAEERGITLEEAMDEYRKGSSLGELVTVDQVAWAATILLDAEARALHGSTLAVSGGRLKGIF